MKLKLSKVMPILGIVASLCTAIPTSFADNLDLSSKVERYEKALLQNLDVEKCKGLCNELNHSISQTLYYKNVVSFYTDTTNKWQEYLKNTLEKDSFQIYLNLKNTYNSLLRNKFSLEIQKNYTNWLTYYISAHCPSNFYCNGD